MELAGKQNHLKPFNMGREFQIASCTVLTQKLFKHACSSSNPLFIQWLFLSDLQKLINTRQQLDGQLNENKVVKEVKPTLMIYFLTDRFT